MTGHLTAAERDLIAQLFQQGTEQQQIARTLGRHPATISRELKRNRTNRQYLAAQAQQHAERRRSQRPIQRKMDDPAIALSVQLQLAQGWSPEQIAGRMKREHPEDTAPCVSAPTIYAWIEQDAYRTHWLSFLRRRGRRPCRKNTQKTSDRTRLEHRPHVIEQRRRRGDFEGDTVLGPPGTGGLVTLVDRQSRFTVMTKIQSKNADHVHEKIKQRLQALADEQRHSVTFDNGSEFARCDRLENHLGIELYYADPGCPFQRGTNENTNGLIRQYFPKGTDFRTISHYEVRRVENLLNQRPRACLDFQTPTEVFHGNPPPSNCD